MISRLIPLLCISALPGFFSAGTAPAQDNGQARPHPEVDMAAGMERWQAAMSPGPQHKYLDGMTGEVGKAFLRKTRIIDENTHVMEMHDPVLGEGKSKVMEITYTRKK